MGVIIHNFITAIFAQVTMAAVRKWQNADSESLGRMCRVEVSGVSRDHGVAVDVDLLGRGVVFDSPAADTLAVEHSSLLQLPGYLFVDVR